MSFIPRSGLTTGKRYRTHAVDTPVDPEPVELPSDIADLEFWYDADSSVPTEDGGLLTALSDLSGNDEHLAVGSGAGELRDAMFRTLKGARLQGSVYAAGAVPLTDAGTFFAVVRPAALHLGGIVGRGAHNASTPGVMLRTLDNGDVQVLLGDGTARANATLNGVYEAGTLLRIIGRWTGTTLALNINGVDATPTGHALGSPGTAGVQVGDTSPFNVFNGGLGAVGGYSRSIDNTEKDALAAYLLQRFPDLPLVGYWRLNDASGPAVDQSANENDGAYTNVTLGEDPIVAGGIASSLFGGPLDPGFVTIDHISAYAGLDAWTLTGVAQLNAISGSGAQMDLVQKDAPGVQGGVEVHVRTDGGGVPRWGGYIKNSSAAAIFIGGSSAGVAGVEVEVRKAYRWALSRSDDGVLRFFEDGVQLDMRGGTAGMAANGQDIGVGIYLPTQAAALDGWQGDLRLYGTDLTGEELKLLPAPLDIPVEPDEPDEPVGTFTCIARPTGVLFSGYAGLTPDSDEFFTLNQAAADPTVRYDFRETVKTIALSGSGIWPQSGRALMSLNGTSAATTHNGACVSAGALICTNMTDGNDDPDHNWDNLYQSSNEPRAPMRFRMASIKNMLFEGQRFHGLFDGLQLLSNPENFDITDLTFSHQIFTLMRDDCLENDSNVPNVLFQHGFYQGMHTFSSRLGTADGSESVNTFSDCCCEVIPIRIGGVPNRSKGFFKMSSNSVVIDSHDCVYAAHIFTYEGVGGHFSNLLSTNKDGDWTNNTFCWLGSGSYPHDVPDGTTVLTGSSAQAAWAAAVQAKYDQFMGHRTSFDPPAP